MVAVKALRLICVNLRNLRIFYLRHVMSLSVGSKSATTEKSRKFGADSHDKYGITAQANALSLLIGGQRRERNRGCSAWLPSPYRSVEELRMIHRINSAVIGLLASIVLISAAGCTQTVAGPNLGLWTYPIPLPAYFQKREEDAFIDHLRYKRAVILGPLTPGARKSRWIRPRTTR